MYMYTCLLTILAQRHPMLSNCYLYPGSFLLPTTGNFYSEALIGQKVLYQVMEEQREQHLNFLGLGIILNVKSVLDYQLNIVSRVSKCHFIYMSIIPS